MSVTIIGEHFTESSRVFWDGAERTSHFVNEQRLEIDLDSAELSRAQTVQVHVRTDAALSDPAPFRIGGLVVKLTSQDQVTIESGSLVNFAARVVSEAGTDVDLPVTWSTSDPTVAVVDRSGHVMGIRPGSALIYASAHGYSAYGRVIVNPMSPMLPDCSGAGTVHSSDVTTPERWTRAQSPHHVIGTIKVFNPVTIEPGVVICGGAAAWIDVRAGGKIDARGTAQQPIDIAASVLTNGLMPLVYTDTSVFKHVHSYYGIGLHSTNVIVDSSTVNGTLGLGFDPNASVRVQNSSVYGQLYVGGHVSVESTLVRSRGVVLLGDAHARLVDVRIEATDGIGLQMINAASAPAILTEARGIRIHHSSSYPAQLSVQGAARLLSSQAAQDSILGNARDTLIVFGKTTETLSVRRGLPWLVVPPETDKPMGNSLSVGAIQLEAGAEFIGGIALGRVSAIGSASDPVVFRRGSIVLLTPGSEMSFFRITDAPNDALRIQTTVELNSCKVVRSGGDGIRVENDASAVIRNCDLEDNAALAIENGGSGRVQAFDVWLKNNGTRGVELISTRTTPNWPGW